MSRSFSIYDTIRSLTHQLQNETRVKKRRELGEKILEMLSKESVRKKLAQEAVAASQSNRAERSSFTSTSGSTSTLSSSLRRNALSATWNFIIQSAIHSTDSIIASGKVKLTADDVKLPLRLLQQRDKTDASFISTSSRFSRNFLKFCLDLLKNDDALRLAEGALLQNGLLYLSSRVDYVAYWRPDEEIRDIMAVVEVCLAKNDGNISLTAAKIFANLLQTAFDLGIAMHLLIPSSIELISNWCEERTMGNLARGVSPCELSYVYKALSILLRFHPDQCIQPLTRHGHHILTYAKSCYSKSNRIDRISLHEYFLAHVLVSQEAGKLQGLLPCDLGEMGKATLSSKQIESLLKLVTSTLFKAEIKTTRNRESFFQPLDDSLKKHLELTARLLACAQREYLVKEEWNVIENHHQYLIDEIDILSTVEEEHLEPADSTKKQLIPLDVLIKSPWIKFVLHPLNCIQIKIGVTATVKEPPASYFPILDLLSEKSFEYSMEQKSIIPLLLLISACSETFPTGATWISSLHDSCYSIYPNDSLAEDVLLVTASNPTNLAILIHLVTNLLDAFGGPTGDPQLQIWILLCLIHLTEAHAVTCFLFRKKAPCELTPLTIAWRRAWNVIFQPEHRYAAYTKNTATGATGELVLSLITKMIRHCCTDPETKIVRSTFLRQSTFAYRKQAQIWSLPAFAKCSVIKSTSPFELIEIFLHNVGLSNDGVDNIDSTLRTSFSENSESISHKQRNGRRYRLLSLCLLFFDSLSTDLSPKEKKIADSVVSCMATLVHGKGGRSGNIGLRSCNILISKDNPLTITKSGRFCCTNLPTVSSFPDLKNVSENYSLLDPLRVPGTNLVENSAIIDRYDSDIPIVIKLKLLSALGRIDSSSPHVDFVSTSESDRLHKIMRSYLKELLSHWRSCRAQVSNDSPVDQVHKDVSTLKCIGDSADSIHAHTLWMKVMVGANLSCRDGLLPTELDNLSKDIVVLLSTIKSNLPSLCENRDEFAYVFLDLLQIIRSLMVVSTTGTFPDLPEPVLKGLALLLDDCKTLLNSFANGGRNENIFGSVENDEYTIEKDNDESDSSVMDKTSNIDILDDNEDDDMVNLKSQKRRKARQTPPKKSKRMKLSNKSLRGQAFPPNSFCSYLIAAIILALDPSLSSCELILDCLIGSESENLHCKEDIAFSNSLRFYRLLSDQSIIFHEGTTKKLVDNAGTNDFSTNSSSIRQDSVISLLCATIRTLRLSAPSYSQMYLFGFQLCAEFIRLGESEFRCLPVSKEEATGIVQLLAVEDNKQDQRNLALRPHLRIARLQAATDAFAFGQQQFHDAFDSLFPPRFVIPSLHDLSYPVRKKSCTAVGVALRILPRISSDKIINSISKHLPPVSLEKDEKDKRSIYQDWFQHKQSTEMEYQVWEDAKISMEYSAIICRSAVAGASWSPSNKSFFELVEISAFRPDLELVCFRACDNIAVMLGYDNVEKLISDERFGVVKKWIDKGTSFLHIPLLVSAPGLMRKILYKGKNHLLVTDSLDNVDITELREIAVAELLKSISFVLIPHLIVQVVSNIADASILSEILKNKHINEFCSLVIGDCNESVVKKVIRKHMHDIYAFCAPLDESGMQMNQDIGAKTIAFLKEFLTSDTVQRHMSRKVHLAARRILYFSGNRDFFSAPNLRWENFSQAIISLVENFAIKDSRSKGDILSRVGTSLSECLLFARLWLEEASRKSQREARWSTMEALCNLLLTQMKRKHHNQTQLGFCVHVILDLILHPNLLCIRHKALEILKTFLNEDILAQKNDSLKREIAFVSKRLIGVCMKLHEQSQKQFIDQCIAMEIERRRVLRQSLGIMGGDMNSNNAVSRDTLDVWGWNRNSTDDKENEEDMLKLAISDHGLEQKNEFFRCSIIDTYDVLKIALERITSLGLDSELLIGARPPFSISSIQLNALEEFDSQFCAQNMTLRLFEELNFESKIEGEFDKTCISTLLRSLRNRHSWMESVPMQVSRTSANDIKFQSNDGLKFNKTLTMAQWLLKAELSQTEQILRRSREDDCSNIQPGDLEEMVRELSVVCTNQCPEELRLAASRCLGELDLLAFENCYLSEYSTSSDTPWVEHMKDLDHLILCIQAKGVTILAKCLCSSHIKIAMSAMETILALFSTKEGQNCLKMVEDEDVKCLLQPFLDNKRPENNLSRNFRNSSSEKQSDSKWCWSEHLWQCRGVESSFEVWICHLVPAIITCYFEPSNVDEETGASKKALFFSLCKKISSFSPGFAATIFPGIIVELLRRPESNSNVSECSTSSKVFVDTWIGYSQSQMNERLTAGFQLLLDDSQTDSRIGNKILTTNPRALTLILDTLDVLRRITQQRFLMSDNHRTAVSGPSKLKKRERSLSSSARRNSNAPKLWKGVPYGIVLRLDGQSVVRSFLKVKRYASALFYSDMYADSCFRGSGAIMEQISNDSMLGNFNLKNQSTTEISGFCPDANPADSETLRQRALAAISSLSRCFLKLGEESALQALQRQSFGLTLIGSDSLEIANNSMSFPSLDDLQRADILSNVKSSSECMRIVEMMGDLGLQKFLKTYIDGLNVRILTDLSEDDRLKIRDKWFECSLYEMRWDPVQKSFESLLSENTMSQEIFLSSNLSQESCASSSFSDVQEDQSGFHEAMLKGLEAFRLNDLDSCRGLLIVARRNLLDSIASAGVGETPLGTMSLLAEKLQSLNDIESLVNVSEPQKKVLKRWGFLFGEKGTIGSQLGHSGMIQDDSKANSKILFKNEYRPYGFLSCIREIVLQTLNARFLEKLTPCEYDARECLVAYLWNVCSGCRELGRHDMAESSLFRLKSVLRSVDASNSREIAQPTLGVLLRQRLEEARLMESRGNFTGAIRLAKQITSRLKHGTKGKMNAIDCLLVNSLVTCGRWMTEYKVEPAKTVLEYYLSPGAKLASLIYDDAKTKTGASLSVNASLALAQFVSNLYETVSSRVRGTEWIISGKGLFKREKELEYCEKMIKNSKGKPKTEVLVYTKNLKQEITLLQTEREKIEGSVREHLHLAIKSFVSALSTADVGERIDMSRHVFRMIFLWLSNCGNCSRNDDINSTMSAAIEVIPSFRFVPLAKQLFSYIELCRDNDSFQEVLHRLIIKMCADHPYHCIVQLISLRNGKKIGSGVSGLHADNFLENASDSKVDAANALIGKLKKNRRRFIGKLIDSYDTLMDAYNNLAMLPTKELVRKKKTRFSFAATCPARFRLDKCILDSPPCVLTKPPPLRTGCDYGDGKSDPLGAERISGFHHEFSITETGLHRPKIVICIGSLGGRFRQVVKGEDDIRQDAVMEQVFCYVNELMRSRRTVGRCSTSVTPSFQLKLVTYNIVPLSPASGVLEWVENCAPFGDFLTDKDNGRDVRIGAHSRYYPNEWGDQQCRIHLGSKKDKRQAFDEICQSYSPAFRFFFVERFGHSMKDWYAAKMRYTRSVAVSSIVGHILGIGDRHCQNILVHQKTGEIVHIDFGIVFEQGKLLPVPEQVPFRLTKNVIDGMGPTGIEGTFTSAAEETVNVLRKNANALLTILSAIVSDPLYQWVVSPISARQRQRLTMKGEDENSFDISDTNDAGTTESSDRNQVAAQTIAKIHQKLQGYEDGTSGEQQSIEGQVQLLINSARDPDKLCVMFPGWAPWI